MVSSSAGAGVEGLLSHVNVTGVMLSAVAGAEGMASGVEADWAWSSGVAGTKGASATLVPIRRPWRSAMVFSPALTSAASVRIRPWIGGRTNVSRQMSTCIALNHSRCNLHAGEIMALKLL